MDFLYRIWSGNYWNHIGVMIGIISLLFTTIQCIRSMRNGFLSKPIFKKISFVVSFLFILTLSLGICLFILNDFSRAAIAGPVKSQNNSSIPSKEKETALRQELALRKAQFNILKTQTKLTYDEQPSDDFKLALPDGYHIFRATYPMNYVIDSNKPFIINVIYFKTKSITTADLTNKNLSTLTALDKSSQDRKIEKVMLNGHEWAMITAKYNFDEQLWKTLIYVYGGDEGSVQMTALGSPESIDKYKNEITNLFNSFEFEAQKSSDQ